MSELKKLLAQVNLSLLIQFAMQPESEALLVDGLKESLPYLKKIPMNMIRYASFVIPDRPVNALGDQEITLRKLVDWYFTEKGGLSSSQSASGEKTIKAVKKGSLLTKMDAERQRAHDVMGRATRVVMREYATAQVARKYYEVNRDKHKQMTKDDSVEPDAVQKQHQQLLKEAENLTEKMDRLGWATMLFEGNIHVIENAGIIDISGYKEECRPLFDEVMSSHLKKTVKPSKAPSMG